MKTVILATFLFCSCAMPVSQSHAIFVTLQCIAIHGGLNGNTYEDVRSRLKDVPVDTTNERELRRRYVRLLLPDLGFLSDYGLSLFSCVE
jgi:hypothetical protein